MKPALHPIDLAAFVWSVFFGLVHLYWGLGGTGGLGRHRVSGALLVIDWMAALLCGVAAWVAYAGFNRPANRARRSWFMTLAWLAAALLGLRGLVGLIQNTQQDRSGMPWGVVLADPFFLLGGLLFAGVGWLWLRANTR